MNWSEIEETSDSTALQCLELRARGHQSRIRIEYGIVNAGSLLNSIVARTEHLVDKAKLPFAFEPQKRLFLLSFWFLPTAVLAGAALQKWNGNGPYELLLGAVAWFCLGLAFWLFGVQRILVEADGVTITRRARSRSVPFSETRDIVIDVRGAGGSYLNLSLVLNNSRNADLSYAGVDKIFLYHLLRRALRARRTKDPA